MSQYATDVVDYHARRRPDQVAIDSPDTGESITWAQLERRVARLAGVLAARFGVRPGDRVAVLAANHPHLVDLQFATFRLGAVFVPYSWRLAQPELEFCCRDTEPTVLFHDDTYADTAVALAADTGIAHVVGWECSDHAPALDDLLEAATPVRAQRLSRLDGAAQLLYTSGTTGRPKAAICTHASLPAQLLNIQSEFTIGPRSRNLAALPFFHSAGLNALTNPVLRAGGGIMLLRATSPARWFAPTSASATATHRHSRPPGVAASLCRAPIWPDATGVGAHGSAPTPASGDVRTVGRPAAGQELVGSKKSPICTTAPSCTWAIKATKLRARG